MEDIKIGDYVKLSEFGVAQLVDGLAAGSAWLQFKLEDGRRVNLNMDEWEHEGLYVPRVTSDGGFAVNGEDFPQDVFEGVDRMIEVRRLK